MLDTHAKKFFMSAAITAFTLMVLQMFMLESVAAIVMPIGYVTMALLGIVGIVFQAGLHKHERNHH